MASVSRESQTHWTSAVGVLSIAFHASLTVTGEEDSVLVLKGSQWPEKRSDLLMVAKYERSRSEADHGWLGCPQRSDPRRLRPTAAGRCPHCHLGALTNLVRQLTRRTEPETAKLAWPQGRRWLELGLEGMRKTQTRREEELKAFRQNQRAGELSPEIWKILHGVSGGQVQSSQRPGVKVGGGPWPDHPLSTRNLTCLGLGRNR